jgi:hypothetical protein
MKKKIATAAKNLAQTLSNYNAKVTVRGNVLKVNNKVTAEIVEKDGNIVAVIRGKKSNRPSTENVSNIKSLIWKLNHKGEFKGAAKLAKLDASVSAPAVKTIEKPSFDVLERFSFMAKMTKMVTAGVTPSLLITGEGGLGKTYCVMQEMSNAGLEEDIDYTVVKGFSTARGLFNTLYENSDKLIIFDDCDSILKDATAINLLKAALDSYERRVITWNAQSWDESRPNKFEFTGKIIFISNLSQEKVDQAVKSRALRVDLSMTADEKIKRMQSILGDVLPEYNMEIKTDALKFLDDNKEKASELNMRTLLQVCKIRGTFPSDWKGVAMYTLTA